MRYYHRRPHKFRLSGPMQTALAVARANGNALHKVTGGYWTWLDCPLGKSNPEFPHISMPVWFVLTSTINGLVARDLAEIVARRPNGEPCQVKIVGTAS